MYFHSMDKKSLIWRFFNQCGDSAKQKNVICNLCGQVLNFRIRHFEIHLWRHVVKFHSKNLLSQKTHLPAMWKGRLLCNKKENWRISSKNKQSTPKNGFAKCNGFSNGKTIHSKVKPQQFTQTDSISTTIDDQNDSEKLKLKCDILYEENRYLKDVLLSLAKTFHQQTVDLNQSSKVKPSVKSANSSIIAQKVAQAVSLITAIHNLNDDSMSIENPLNTTLQNGFENISTSSRSSPFPALQKNSSFLKASSVLPVNYDAKLCSLADAKKKLDVLRQDVNSLRCSMKSSLRSFQLRIHTEVRRRQLHASPPAPSANNPTSVRRSVLNHKTDLKRLALFVPEFRRDLKSIHDSQVRLDGQMKKSLLRLQDGCKAVLQKGQSLSDGFELCLPTLWQLVEKFCQLKLQLEADFFDVGPTSAQKSNQGCNSSSGTAVNEAIKRELEFHRLESLEKQKTCLHLKSRLNELEQDKVLLKDELNVANERRQLAEQRLETAREQIGHVSAILF